MTFITTPLHLHFKSQKGFQSKESNLGTLTWQLCQKSNFIRKSIIKMFNSVEKPNLWNCFFNLFICVCFVNDVEFDFDVESEINATHLRSHFLNHFFLTFCFKLKFSWPIYKVTYITVTVILQLYLKYINCIYVVK